MSDVYVELPKEGVICPEVPTVRLCGEDGNAFAIMGKVSKAMMKAGVADNIRSQYRTDAMAGDYDNLLVVTMKYVDID